MSRIRSAALIAATASLTLAAVAPTGALADTKNDLNNPPVDKNGKKYCPIRALDNSITWEQHGTTITMTWPGGGTRTSICNDGEWKDARLAPLTSIHVTVDSAYIDASGALVLNPTAPIGTIRGG
jgi:hypothetical protein